MKDVLYVCVRVCSPDVPLAGCSHCSRTFVIGGRSEMLNKIAKKKRTDWVVRGEYYVANMLFHRRFELCNLL